MRELKVAILMDSIEKLNSKKDTTFAMMLEAKRRGYKIFVFNTYDIYIENEIVFANTKEVDVFDDTNNWYQYKSDKKSHKANYFDVIIMRKDPPFNINYIYATYLLELAQNQGVLVVNNPKSLRDANEKIFTLQFSQCITDTIVSANINSLKTFATKHKNTVAKPLGAMGGVNVFKVDNNDKNISVILENLTKLETTPIIMQRFIPEIEFTGDKRILLINGEPIPYAYSRKAKKGEFRANLATGAIGEGVELTKRDFWLCEQIAPKLIEMELLFVGIDVIGDYITEINVTSPTCVRELDKIYNLNIAAIFFEVILEKITKTCK